MILVYKLELNSALQIHPCPIAFVNESQNYPFSKIYLFGLSKKKTEKESSTSGKSEFVSSIQDFQQIFNVWNEKTSGMDLQLKHIKWYFFVRVYVFSSNIPTNCKV
jgi:hypothetical protein